jgi:hypothetical protein
MKLILKAGGLADRAAGLVPAVRIERGPALMRPTLGVYLASHAWHFWLDTDHRPRFCHTRFDMGRALRSGGHARLPDVFIGDQAFHHEPPWHGVPRPAELPYGFAAGPVFHDCHAVWDDEAVPVWDDAAGQPPVRPVPPGFIAPEDACEGHTLPYTGFGGQDMTYYHERGECPDDDEDVADLD